MTEVSFHFNAPDKLGYACRLLRKAFNAKARVVVLANANDLATLDAQLWTFSALEFIPHCHAQAQPDLLQASPIVLTSTLEDSAQLPHHQVLVNLDMNLPMGFEKFERVVEVVTLDEEERQQARRRWKHYADRGYPIVRHDLALKESA
jgi:DNA polymerase III subunit chi